ncbi:dTDP-4-dehydrorhamnose 3,5-epimerase [Paenibacillus rigui]|uniref:dTDP-4-dehydrorhamnose 3,5-epimerase n=1 Tax=Paenibacillus rigui TaxID=554312 RepID=A0A229UYD8_9BACL|nr:dTDP-4-dehydrorhamnose 3,5-epimerase [Paenibacillus rigui]OXM88403.1 dTDP-4-dehydrorhamnose 3,5-epimerase [Paenibacillus rigui]
MKVLSTKLKGVFIIEPAVFQDARGFFTESYNQQAFEKHGLQADFIQDNHSLSVEKGVLRGMHYQLNPKAQTKLVRVTAGAIYDIILDIRRGSVTFGQWIGVQLSAENKRQLWVPKGFAHGFCTLFPNTEVQYKVDEYYSPEHDRGIAWNDPDLQFDWPEVQPILSPKDSNHPPLQHAEMNFD